MLKFKDPKLAILQKIGLLLPFIKKFLDPQVSEIGELPLGWEQIFLQPANRINLDNTVAKIEITDIDINSSPKIRYSLHDGISIPDEEIIDFVMKVYGSLNSYFVNKSQTFERVYLGVVHTPKGGSPGRQTNPHFDDIYRYCSPNWTIVNKLHIEDSLLALVSNKIPTNFYLLLPWTRWSRGCQQAKYIGPQLRSEPNKITGGSPDRVLHSKPKDVGNTPEGRILVFISVTGITQN